MKAEDAIRLNWWNALDDVDNGTKLSKKIGWGFSTQDLLVLTCLHEANINRQKIEDLLEDCNFHTENGLLMDEEYDECRKVIIGLGK